jgi:hypothetical protein
MAQAMSRDRTKNLATDLIDRGRKSAELARHQVEQARQYEREQDLSLGF